MLDPRKSGRQSIEPGEAELKQNSQIQTCQAGVTGGEHKTPTQIDQRKIE